MLMNWNGWDRRVLRKQTFGESFIDICFFSEFLVVVSSKKYKVILGNWIVKRRLELRGGEDVFFYIFVLGCFF